MKVFYVCNNIDGCWYYRTYLPVTHNGWDADKTVLGWDKAIDRQVSFQKAMAADIVVFQRPDEAERVKAMYLLKKAGKKIVFENDDTYKINDAMKFGEEFKRRSKLLDEAIKIADLCTTTTEFLADEYRKLNKNVVVLPNQIDPMDWDEPLKNETDKVRIGMFGSVTHNGDYESCRSALEALGKRNDVQLVILGLPTSKACKRIKKLYKKEIDFWTKIDIEWHPLVPIHQVFETLNEMRLDISLIPRKDNYFNRCKSNVKFLESSILEIPVIAQGFADGLSPYQGEEDRKHMIIIEDDKEWYEAIDTLVKNKGLRQEIGKDAKKYVLKNYNIEKNYVLWDKAFKKLMK